jgi:hypothetical protein
MGRRALKFSELHNKSPGRERIDLNLLPSLLPFLLSKDKAFALLSRM